MNQQTQNHLTKDVEVLKWDKLVKKPVKVQTQIIINEENQIIYSYNGQILRKELIYDNFENTEILTTMDQIKYLQWVGEYGQNKKKCGQWKLFWNGELLIEVGGYYINGLKQGLWKEPMKNFWGHAQVYESGEYVSNIKSGEWIYLYENKNIIGGGSYNQQGVKNGNWIELSERFYSYSQVTYNGQYNNGKKVGKWDTAFKLDDVTPFKQIGGGSYDEKGDEIKIGKWIELCDYFTSGFQDVSEGDYKNGNKVGIWVEMNIWLNKKTGEMIYDN